MDWAAFRAPPPFRPLTVLCGRNRGRISGRMHPSDAEPPSPAPLSAELDRTGVPARDRSPPTPRSERADSGTAAAADAGFAATEALSRAHIGPEHDPAATLPAPVPDRADGLAGGPEDAGAGSSAQDILAPGE